jgi:hypothetical protein
MKNPFYVLPPAFFCLFSTPAISLEETFTYGTPPSSGGFNFTMPAHHSYVDPYAQMQASVYASIAAIKRKEWEEAQKKRNECIKKAQTEYNDFVALSKVTLLDNSASNCQRRFPAQATIYWLNGNDNAYSQCIRGDEQTFNVLVEGAKEVMNTKLKGC